MALVGRYGLVTATVAIGLAGAVLALTGHAAIVPWLFSGFAVLAAIVEAVGMVRQLRAGIFGIDVLAVLAIVATVAVGEYIASLIIVLMIAGGGALEDYARGRAQRELDALLTREPQVAHVQRHDPDRVEDVAVDIVEIGDELVVRSGEVVPVDGRLVSHEATFDLSSITGESLPATIAPGGSVLSGSVNGSAVALITASARAADSQYQGIVALVRQAAENRAPVVRLADRFALPFTIVSVLIAGIAWAVSGQPVRAAEVLVLATPCPLLLAAPIAFIGGMSRAARAGIIVKGGAVLEVLSRARSVVFDKTGTLTAGAPSIAAVVPYGGWDAAEVLTLAASAERFSSHVLAQSIAREAEARGSVLVTAHDVVEEEARGVEARVDGHVVDVGTLAFVRSRCGDVDPAAIGPGQLAVYVAVDGRFAGTILATDPIRENARGTVGRLRTMGIEHITMLSGDARATADDVAARVGITEVRADCLPADKVAALTGMTSRPVVMAGDGVNDAPVLAAADVGIAMGARGASAASESASAVILLDDISLVADAIAIGRGTVRIALQSMGIGVALSVVLMVVAAFGVIPAVVGAAVQELVDLATILNSLRTLRVSTGRDLRP